MKRGVKDVLAPQGLFEDLGLKYLGPVDGHDLAALEHAFMLARRFNGPVIVHCVTMKGFGYAPAENDESDQMHQSAGFDPSTGAPSVSATRRWTKVFSDELVSIAEKRDDIVAITAAMCEPTGLGAFARRFPDRFYDVGIAEQHAVTSAAGLAYGGMHPVVAVYATFLNRAFDQFLMDVALHRLPVTVVLDRAGITGDDGPSHNGVWDMSILGVVPGLSLAAPRDEETLRRALNTAVDIVDGPSVLRFPKTPLPSAINAIRHEHGADVLAETGEGDVDVLIVSVGAMAAEVLEAIPAFERAGYTYRVIDLGWVLPVPMSVMHCAQRASLVVTVEDGIVAGGIGSQISRVIRESGSEVATREIGVPVVFPQHGKIAQVRAAVGLNAQGIGRRIVEWAAQVVSDEGTPSARRERTGSEAAALDESSADSSD
jgi:1-deoxy-D-xylulose-5-phosphate synthase